MVEYYLHSKSRNNYWVFISFHRGHTNDRFPLKHIMNYITRKTRTIKFKYYNRINIIPGL